MQSQIISYANQLNIDTCGFTLWNNRSVFVALFPYYTGKYEEIGVSRYARINDYHKVCQSHLIKIGNHAKSMDISIQYELSVDKQGNPERLWAKSAGLGIIGKNHCLIHPKYGSFVFIGALIFNKTIPRDDNDTNVGNSFPVSLSLCCNCNNCVNACPTGTLKTGDFNLCLSHITQQKHLDEVQTQLLDKNANIWGCDICQNTCPYNQDVKLSPILEFYQNQINSLSIFDGIHQLSNKEFQKKYQNYPFTWKGKGVIERNLKIYTDK